MERRRADRRSCRATVDSGRGRGEAWQRDEPGIAPVWATAGTAEELADRMRRIDAQLGEGQ
jgi:hypothetical protein